MNICRIAMVLLVASGAASSTSASSLADDDTPPRQNSAVPQPATPNQPSAVPGRGSAGTRGGGGFGGGGTLRELPMGSPSGPTMGATGTFSISTRTALSDRPAVIVTRPMNRQTMTEWKEDLNVMDKLLRDEIGRVTGEAAPQAMGIRLMMFGNAEPMYVEDLGALFCSTSNTPLAAAETAAGTTGPSARDSSAWERAKSEIAAGRLSPEGPTNGSSRTVVPPIKFDQEKLNDLVESIQRTLVEAKNIRHLKSDEMVIVTIAGFDDGGAPVRLTLKAKKSDIEQAASGKLKFEEFKKRIASCVG